MDTWYRRKPSIALDRLAQVDRQASGQGTSLAPGDLLAVLEIGDNGAFGRGCLSDSARGA